MSGIPRILYGCFRDIDEQVFHLSEKESHGLGKHWSEKDEELGAKIVQN